MDTWKISDKIICQQLTSEYLEEALCLFETAFYPYENICRALGVSKNPKALEELRELTTITAKDGLCIIAIDTSSRKVVGAAFNKIQVSNNPVFENFSENWKCFESKALVEFMAYFDNLCNLFQHCNVDCIFELMFLVTCPDYRGKGIAKKLTEISIDVARQLANGINVKKSLDDTKLVLEPIPKLISAIFTSPISQKIGRDLQFEKAIEKYCKNIDFKKVDLDEIIKSGREKITLEYKHL